MEKELDVQFNGKVSQVIEEKEKCNRAKFLSELAEDYFRRAETSGEWLDFFKAHGLFNACGKREPACQVWDDRAYEVERKYQSRMGGEASKVDLIFQKAAIKHLQKTLSDTRNDIKSSLSEADEVAKSKKLQEKVFCKKMKIISAICCKKMVSVVADIMNLAVKMSGKLPCEYAVVAIGSMAKCEVTPYSDLEYFFLIEKEEHQPEFERLAVTSYFIINNFRESDLKIYDLNEFKVPDSTKRGFEIDGLSKKAGNIPTGHGPGTATNNKFIKTIDGLVSLYEETLASPKGDAKIADLSAMLASTAFICGNEELYMKLTSRIRTVQPNEARKNRSITMLQLDVKKYSFLPDETIGEIKEVKEDIFRFPSIIIYDLKIACQMQSAIVWDVLDELMRSQKISTSVATSLEIIMCAAQYVRLSAYLLYEAQNENISVLPALRLTEKLAYFPQSLFLLMCLHLIPLKNMIGVKGLTLEHFQQEVPSDPHIAVAYTSYYMNDFCTCVKSFEAKFQDAMNIRDQDQLVMYIKALTSAGELKAALNCVQDGSIMQSLSSEQSYVLKGEVLFSLGMYSESLESYLAALDIQVTSQKALETHAYRRIAIAIGGIYANLGERSKSLEYYMKMRAGERLSENAPLITMAKTFHLGFKEHLHLCKRILKHRIEEQLKKYGDETCHPDIAHHFSLLGEAHNLAGEFDEALSYFIRSLEMHEKMYGSVNHPTVANSNSKIGIVNFKLANYTEAIKFFKKSLTTMKQLYGSSNPNTAEIYHDLSRVHLSLANPNKAKSYARKVLEITDEVYGKKQPRIAALSYEDLGTAHMISGEYQEAMCYFQISLKIKKDLYGSENHFEVAGSYYNIGVAHVESGCYDEAFSFLNRSLEILKREYVNIENHPDLSDVYHNLGLAHFGSGQYEEALHNYNRSLEIRKHVYGNAAHPSIAASHNNIGNVYEGLENFAVALNYYKTSLEIMKQVFRDQSHPDIASTYANMGSAYLGLGDYAKALRNQETALEMSKTLYRNADHPLVAKLHLGMAKVHLAQFNFPQVLRSANASVEIYRKVFGNSHHPNIAKAYILIGVVHAQTGQYSEAVRYYEDSLEINKRVYGSRYYFEMVNTYLMLSAVQYMQGKFYRSLKNFKKSYKKGLMGHAVKLWSIISILRMTANMDDYSPSFCIKLVTMNSF